MDGVCGPSRHVSFLALRPRRRNERRTMTPHDGRMPTDERPRPARHGKRRAIRPEWAVVAIILSVAGVLSAASIASDPSSVLTLTMASLYGAIGALLATRRPRNPIGWLFLGILLVFSVSTAADGLGGAAVRAGGRLPGGLPLFLIWAETWAYAALFGIYYGLTVVFPSGHLPGGHFGRVVRISFLVPVAAVVTGAFGSHLAGNFSSDYIGRTLDNPAALVAVPDGLPALLQLATIGLLVGGIVSMIIRLRRARGIEREQLKWFVASLALTGVLVVATVAVVVASPRVGTEIWILAVLGYATIPPAVGVAVLRYHLYEIDRIVSRTVGWAIVTAVLAVVFVSVILISQSLLVSVTSSNSIAVATSTLVAAAIAQPLRRWVQRRVDRRFNRARYDAERTVAGFGTVLRNEVELDQLRAEIGAAVAETVQPASFHIWLRA